MREIAEKKIEVLETLTAAGEKFKGRDPFSSRSLIVGRLMYEVRTQLCYEFEAPSKWNDLECLNVVNELLLTLPSDLRSAATRLEVLIEEMRGVDGN